MSNPFVAEIICGVEDGWRGVREFSLSVAAQELSVLVLIRGELDCAVLKLIDTPPGMRIEAVSNRWFRIRILQEVIRSLLKRRLRAVVMTKARTQRLFDPWLKCFGLRVCRIIETEDGFRFDENCPALSPVAPAA